ncbi:MAG: ATP-grasp domain-containing protein [Actinomycetota bacterium]
MDLRPAALIVHPGVRDRQNLEDPDVRAHARAILLEDDAPTDRPIAILQRLAADPRSSSVDGVFGSSDAGVHLAVRLAALRGLPGPTPEAFMRCHDKLESRRLQRAAVPLATPRFFSMDPSAPIPDPLPLPFPLFVKPVSAHLSQLAFPVRDRLELETALEAARTQLDRVAAFDEELEGRSFHLMLVEELLEGRLVTFEGFMHAGKMTPIGVTDSVLHPNGISFVRFDYPSELPSSVSDHLCEIAEVLMPTLGFDGSLFNIEFFVQADWTPKIVEVNGRMASQFAPLVRAVHATSTYRIQLELVTGGSPSVPKPRADVVASSFVLRHYVEDAVVEAVPDPNAVAERFPGSQVELLVQPGQRLSENDDDSASHRLAVVAMSGPDRASLLRDWEEAQGLLTFALRPVDRVERSSTAR